MHHTSSLPPYISLSTAHVWAASRMQTARCTFACSIRGHAGKNPTGRSVHHTFPPLPLSLSADRASKGRPGHDGVEADEASAMSSPVQRYRQWVRDDAADSLLARHQHYHTSVGCFLHRIPLLCITRASLWPQHCWDCLYSMTHLTYKMTFIKNEGELLFFAAQA